MPLWKIYHPEYAFSEQDKLEISEKITSIYRDLPPFYVCVIFEAVAKSSIYLGGKPTNDFVRLSVDHIAKQIKDEETKTMFLAAVAKILASYVSNRGLRWEMHVDETPFSLWTIEGIRPPIPGTPEGDKWRLDNKPSPY